MKMITAMVQPFMLSKVTSALEEIDDFPGITVTEDGRRQAMIEAHIFVKSSQPTANVAALDSPIVAM